MHKCAYLILAVWLAFSIPSLPARADSPQVAPAVCRAVHWLAGQQLPDGSFGLWRPDGTSSPSASVTADAVYALALLGENPAGSRWTRGGRSALDALAALTPTYVYSDAGAAGKVGRAVALAGGNPRAFGGLDLIGVIEAAYDPTTGRYHPNLLYRHTLAVEALLRTGIAVPPAALVALQSAQVADGGWFWAFDATQSDVDSTGRVMSLLAGQFGVNDPAAFGHAADYLATMQATAGGWTVGYLPGSPNANSTALAVGGLRAAGFDPQAARFQKNGRGALDQLLAFQEAGGAFVYIAESGKEESRIMATLDALIALAPYLGGQSPCRAVYLPVFLK
ncbi:MAG: terpene cyclase/mutase family protein [Chloroflexi bacterium]|nr:terpene cyclase/mutase family protein [Chloroflexota bacterium]